MILPSAYTAPRLTVSQQATPCAAAAGFGLNFHFTGAPGFVRSSAYTMFGYGVTTYIVLLTTSGAASWPRSTPVENDQASLRFADVAGVISVQPAEARVRVVLRRHQPLAVVGSEIHGGRGRSGQIAFLWTVRHRAWCDCRPSRRRLSR